jgi:hypothetical protein
MWRALQSFASKVSTSALQGRKEAQKAQTIYGRRL